MESGRGYARFFFKDAPQRISAVLDYARKRYPDLFDGNKVYKRNTPGSSYRNIVGKLIQDRYDQLYHLAEYDPHKIMDYERIPIMDYYMILNSRVQAVQKAKESKARAAAKK